MVGLAFFVMSLQGFQGFQCLPDLMIVTPSRLEHQGPIGATGSFQVRSLVAGGGQERSEICLTGRRAADTHLEKDPFFRHRFVDFRSEWMPESRSGM